MNWNYNIYTIFVWIELMCNVSFGESLANRDKPRSVNQKYNGMKY